MLDTSNKFYFYKNKNPFSTHRPLNGPQTLRTRVLAESTDKNTVPTKFRSRDGSFLITKSKIYRRLSKGS